MRLNNIRLTGGRAKRSQKDPFSSPDDVVQNNAFLLSYSFQIRNGELLINSALLSTVHDESAQCF